MALHLQFCDNLDSLIPLLAQGLRMHWQDPMQPPRIICPSPSTGKWLQLRLAREMQAIANLPMLTLENFLWSTLQETLQDHNFTLLNANQVAQVLLPKLRFVLNNPNLSEHHIYTPLIEYCTENLNINEKRVQSVAVKIATLLCEYEYNRPSVWDIQNQQWLPSTGIDRQWLQGKTMFSADSSNYESTELWQSALYRELFGKYSPFNSKQESDVTQYKTLPQLHRFCHEQISNWTPVNKTPVYLVQVSKISHFHRNFLLELSQHFDVSVYLTNPCAEFWEDVQNKRKPLRKWNSKQSQKGIQSLQSQDYQREDFADLYPNADLENRLLQLWGKTGKENITLWCQANEYDFEYTKSIDDNAHPDSVLAAVQHSLLHRTPLFFPKPISSTDLSIRLFEAPSRLREVENLRARILDLLHNNEHLKLNQIAVLVTDMNNYQASIDAVFGAYEKNSIDHIPYTILGKKVSDSLVSQGLQALIQIWEGDFSRGAVFNFLRNPLVMNRLNVTRSDVSIWESWAQELEIYRGFNQEQLLNLGEPLATDEHTFDWALARLLTGGLSSGAIDLGFSLDVKAYRDIETSNTQLVELFVKTLETLSTQEKVIRGTTQSIQDFAAQWEYCQKSIEDWLAPFNPQNWDIDLEFRCWKSVQESIEVVNLQSTLGERTEVMPKAELIAQLNQLIPSEVSESAQGWAGKLTFATLKSGNILPHEHMFILGLDSQLFPGIKRVSTLDLISSKRIVGDPDPVQDNRYAFLETIHAARKTLTLSYRALDIQKDAELLPSSVVLEFETILKEASLQNSHLSDYKFRYHIPLLERSSKLNIWDTQELLLNEYGKQEQRALHRLPVINSTQYSSKTPQNRLTQKQVFTFLKNPFEYHLKERLSWGQSKDESTLQITDDPLELSRLVQSQLFDKLFPVLIQEFSTQNPADLQFQLHLNSVIEKQIAQFIQELKLQGQMPQLWYGVQATQQISEQANNLVSAVKSIWKELQEQNLSVEYATNFAWNQENPTQPRQSISIPIAENSPIDFYCKIPHLLICNNSTQQKEYWIIQRRHSKFNFDVCIDAFLQAASLVLGGVQGNIRVILLHSDATLKSFNVIDDVESITQWLQTICTQILIDQHGEHLPFKSIESAWKKEWNHEVINIESEWSTNLWELIQDSLEPSDDRNGYKCYIEDWELGEPRDAFAERHTELGKRVIERYALILRSMEAIK